MKIAIIGNAGSGKSELGLKLHRILGIPLYHLDQYFWKPHWQEPDPAEFEHIHHQLCDQKAWIIEGVATKLFEYRVKKADIVIFLDIPIYLCFYRVLKRMLLNFGNVIPSSAKECPQRIPSLKFLKFIWNFNSERKPIIEALLHKYKDTKQIFVIKNNTEIEALIKKLK